MDANKDTHNGQTAQELGIDLDRQDWLLEGLVEMANKGIEFSITLNVSGAIVSGTLTSNVNYFEGVSKEVAAGNGSKEFLEMFSRFFKTVGETMKEVNEAATKEDADDEGDVAQPTYVHIRDARVIQPGGGYTPSERGVWWRGRISSVDGFWIGSISINR